MRAPKYVSKLTETSDIRRMVVRSDLSSDFVKDQPPLLLGGPLPIFPSGADHSASVCHTHRHRWGHQCLQLHHRHFRATAGPSSLAALSRLIQSFLHDSKGLKSHANLNPSIWRNCWIFDGIFRLVLSEELVQNTAFASSLFSASPAPHHRLGNGVRPIENSGILGWEGCVCFMFPWFDGRSLMNAGGAWICSNLRYFVFLYNDTVLLVRPLYFPCASTNVSFRSYVVSIILLGAKTRLSATIYEPSM